MARHIFLKNCSFYFPMVSFSAFASNEVSYVQFHNMTDNFIHSFVEKHYHDLGCAGVVPMEGVGIQVVAGLRGSMFSIMGLPVYKLLKILRRGVVADIVL